MRRLLGFGLVLVASANACADNPTKLAVPNIVLRDAEYYPIVSKRTGESGRVVLEFTLNRSGVAENIMVLLSDSPRLETAAIFLLQDAHADLPSEWVKNDGPSRRLRIAVIFELKPLCGQTASPDSTATPIRICARRSIWVPDEPTKQKQADSEDASSSQPGSDQHNSTHTLTPRSMLRSGPHPAV
jgi:TonB family protein